jgi:hypothetical protein
MAQDRQSGAEADRFGRNCGALIASVLGAQKMSNTSNECKYEDQRMVIKCAGSGTTKVGVSYHMLKDLDAVLGAFEADHGNFRVYSLTAQDYAAHMKPTRSKGPSAGKVGTVDRTAFKRLGRLIAQVKI